MTPAGEKRNDAIRIFVASPGDVLNERDQLGRVAHELNTTLTALVPERRLVLEMIRWETHGRPGMGNSPQEVLNAQLSLPDVDVFIGIMWRRFGTATGTAGSGTEEEFRIARQSWRDHRKPREILFYFCQAAAGPAATSEEAQQQLAVTRFREELTREGLVWEYKKHSAFADLVRPHLVQVVSGILRHDVSPAQAAAQSAAPLPLEVDLDETRRQLGALAREYESLRADMDPGDSRTRRMEIVASKMRILALSTYPLLPELLDSDSPGMRLAAVSALEAVPAAEHLEWLADRLREEKPFVGYHAALAILAAARSLGATELPKVTEAISVARRERVPLGSDRDDVLRLAEDEVIRRGRPRP